MKGPTMGVDSGWYCVVGSGMALVEASERGCRRGAAGKNLLCILERESGGQVAGVPLTRVCGR